MDHDYHLRPGGFDAEQARSITAARQHLWRTATVTLTRHMREMDPMTRTLWQSALLCLMLATGCQSMSDFNFNPWAEEKAPLAKPHEVVAIWQEGVDVQLDPNNGGVPVPGFSGRVIFHQLQSGKAGRSVAVNGTLLVSFFEDKPSQGPAQPMETWTILPEHLPMLMRQDLSGYGYALWLPWHTYHPSVKSGRLIVQYTSREGEVMRSEPVQIQIVDHNRGGMAKPQVNIEHKTKNTW